MGRMPLGPLEVVWDEDKLELMAAAVRAAGLEFAHDCSNEDCAYAQDCDGGAGARICEA